MNVAEKSWQTQNSHIAYRSVKFPEDAAGTASDPDEYSAEAVDRFSQTSAQNADQMSGSSGSKVKSSTPNDSVGQLAAELSRSETRMDVLQVQSKATRALTNLKMSAYACDEKDAKKVAQMIKRMEKLIKRIQKKAKQLGKEEQMEIQQQKAEKQKKVEKAKQIREELRTRRKKRRREERDYAMKELAEDGKESMSETMSSILGAGTALSGAQTATYTADGSIDLSSISMDGMSVDVTV